MVPAADTEATFELITISHAESGLRRDEASCMQLERILRGTSGGTRNDWLNASRRRCLREFAKPFFDIAQNRTFLTLRQFRG